MKYLIIVAGHAGSGKTEFSGQISRHLSLPLLDKDTLTRAFVEVLANSLTGDPQDRQSPQYLEYIRPLEYTALMETTWDILETGSPGVVITAPFGKELFDPVWISALEAKCEAQGVKLSIVWMYCDSGILKERILHRGSGRDTWKLDNWDQWVSSLTMPALRTQDFYVDNTNPLHILSQKVKGISQAITSVSV